MSQVMLSGRFHAVVKPQGRRAEWSLEKFVEAWSDFVEQVVSGYSGDLYEYENWPVPDSWSARV